MAEKARGCASPPPLDARELACVGGPVHGVPQAYGAQEFRVRGLRVQSKDLALKV